MTQINMKHGLDLKIKGRIESSEIRTLNLSTRVAIRPSLLEGIKVRLLVAEGQKVKTGTPLVCAKKNPEICLVSPATGTVASIQRGHRRVLDLVVIRTESTDQYEEENPGYSLEQIATLKGEEILKKILKAGLWPAFRQFPHDIIADPESQPKGIFISTFNKEPFATDPHILIGEGNSSGTGHFIFGLEVLNALLPGRVNLVHCHDFSAIPLAKTVANYPKANHHHIKGKYPSHHAGVHIYHLDPLSQGEHIWYLDPQDIIAIGELFRNGKLSHERVIAVCGSAAKNTGYVRVRDGSPIEHVVRDFVEHGKVPDIRFIMGGIFSGTRSDYNNYLDHRNYSLHMIPEGEDRRLFSFMRPGFDRYCYSPLYISAILPETDWELSSSKKGGVRACINCGTCETVCPVEILPQFLFKSVLAEDFEEMEKHFILDCSSCGLCTYVCPSKIEIASIIKEGMNLILKEEEASE
ncbi:NADH:ubiquinone reductase (Na(+)-transporting) subunit A [Candidatus Riflebacteria bacterium]